MPEDCRAGPDRERRKHVHFLAVAIFDDAKAPPEYRAHSEHNASAAGSGMMPEGIIGDVEIGAPQDAIGTVAADPLVHSFRRAVGPALA